MAGFYRPSLTDRVIGSPALARRQLTARAIFAAIARTEVHGAEHIPARGPVLLAANHRDFLDGVLVFGVCPRPVTFLVKSEAFTPTAAPFLWGSGQIPIDRSKIDVGALRHCRQVLDAGGAVGIFPEGSRGDGLVHQAKPGVGWLALRTGASVVPVACQGTDDLFRTPRAHITVTFGEPIAVSHTPARRPLNRRQIAATTEQIRAALADLVAGTLPPAAVLDRAA